MAVTSSVRAEPSSLMAKRQWRDRQTSPERTMVWTEPKPRKVPVVYYLCRNGQLEQPHFMEVPLAAGESLRLRDVLDRLNMLRGRGISDVYSWSSKRSYKNGFVWHDLSDDNLIHPTHSHEYVLKGSELQLRSITSSPSSQGTTNSSDSSVTEKLPEMRRSSAEHYGRPDIGRFQSKSERWSSFDVNEYKVYKMEQLPDCAVKTAVDVSTQTDDRSSRRRALVVRDDHEIRSVVEEAAFATTELEAEDISPPPSSSSPETLESSTAKANVIPAEAGRSRAASAVLMHFISCGSINVKGHRDRRHHHHQQWQGFGAACPPELHGRTLSRVRSDLGRKEADGYPTMYRLDRDKEYFSGSLIDTKKKMTTLYENGEVESLPGRLKRSSSYTAERSSKLDMSAEKEANAAKSKCISQGKILKDMRSAF